MKFSDFIFENYTIDDNFLSFIDSLTEYMDLDNKSKIDEIIKKAHSLNIITNKKKVFRVMVIDKEPEFKMKLISSSTSKLKGKVLDNIISDMKDRYSHFSKKTGEIKYVELENVQGIDIEDIGKFILNPKNSKKFDDYTIDVFKRLKSEKEFLIINLSGDLKNKIKEIHDV